ncbi:MAG: hypothetical protein IAE99_07760 [Rhodothermales bacterium]|nr:hypothetical protein [Rhodothermales bacterium]
MLIRPALLALALALPVAAFAQKEAPMETAAPARTVEGRTVLMRWPDSQRTLTSRQIHGFAALPTVDSLTLGYRFVPAGARTVNLDLAVRWTPGTTGILRGRRVPIAEMPDGLRLVSFSVRADVMQGRRKVATFTYAADSTRLAADDVYTDRLAAPLARVFDGLDEAQARRILSEGFTLSNLTLTRAVFTVPADKMPPRTSGSSTVGRDEVRRKERIASREASRRDLWLTVYTVDRALDLAYYAAWMHNVYDRYDDDDERGELLGYALATAVGVGAAAYWGGAAGLYGTGDTPLGATAGYARANGGLMLQASTNLAALGMTGGVERVDVKAVGYRRLGSFPVMPMVGTGMRFTDRNRAYTYDSDRDASRWLLTVGGAQNVGPAVLMAGVEVMSGSPEFGILWRWR